jgi:hypothetical protein
MKSVYFGKRFSVLEMASEGGGCVLNISEYGSPPGNSYLPGVGKDNDLALIGVVDTLRVTRGLLKEALRAITPKIVAANEYHRKIVSLAKKIDATPDEVRAILDSILPELFIEMMDSPPRTDKK